MARILTNSETELYESYKNEFKLYKPNLCNNLPHKVTEKKIIFDKPLREFFENMPADADDDTIKPSLYTQIGFLVDEFYEDAPESYVVEGSIIYDWYLNNEAVMDAFRNPEVSVELLF